MNQLSVRDMHQHVQILGWLLVIGHIVFLAVGVFLFFLLTGIGAASGDTQALAILGVIGTSLGLLLTVLALPGMAAGYGLLTRRSWGRILALVVAAFNVLNFPVGTLLAGYAFWVLLQQAATDYFAGPQPSYS